MLTVRAIDASHQADIRLPNEPFGMFGRMLPSYSGGEWTYTLLRFAPEDVSEMRFPDESYDFDAMTSAGSIFLGAYDGDRCVGLAILQPGFFRYMYLYDLKVNAQYRRRHIGSMLIRKAKETAVQNGYCGLYTQGQDNNPGACLFYLHNGFTIGGLDTNIYRHTAQEGKADILFYCEADA